jgi:nicotinamide phosphoribosyltransferase
MVGLGPITVEHNSKYYKVEFTPEKPTFTEVQATPEQKGAIQCLYETFGGTLSDKGYKTLSDRVGLIYGDSITTERCLDILQRLEAKGFASCNVVLGIGSYTYQYLTRDTLGIALKATYGVVNGVGQEMVKNPKTDSGVKKSAKGLIKVTRDEKGDYHLEEGVTWEQEAEGELKLVFENGQFYNRTTIAEIRQRIRA